MVLRLAWYWFAPGRTNTNQADTSNITQADTNVDAAAVVVGLLCAKEL